MLALLFERIIARDFTPRGHARQVLKDLEMLNDAASKRHIIMPMAGQETNLYKQLISELDGSAILTLRPPGD